MCRGDGLEETAKIVRSRRVALQVFPVVAANFLHEKCETKKGEGMTYIEQFFHKRDHSLVLHKLINDD